MGRPPSNSRTFFFFAFTSQNDVSSCRALKGSQINLFLNCFAYRREARGTTWRCLRTCSVCMAPSFLLFPLNGWLSVLLTRRTANRAHSDRATRLDLCGSFEKLTRHVNRERSLRNASSRDVRIGGCVLVWTASSEDTSAPRTLDRACNAFAITKLQPQYVH